jgi:hypothetical protein
LRLVAQYFSPTSQAWPHVPFVYSLPTLPLSALPPRPVQPKLLVVGDRLATDVILANRLARSTGWQVDGILTTRIWKYEGIGNAVMRLLEQGAFRGIASARRRLGILDKREGDWHDCLREVDVEKMGKPAEGMRPGALKNSVADRLWRWYGGGLGLGVRWPDALQRLRKASRFPTGKLRVP